VSDRVQRLGLNEALFRDVNERIKALQRHFTIPPPLDLVCECANAECTERLEVPVALYERVRDDGALFVVVRGHEEPDVEHVVESHETFHVIRKDPGEPERLAEATHPRR
jgi:hypothetical protein